MNYFDEIELRCIEAFRTRSSVDIFQFQEELMQMEGLPMHCPPHHYMIPAVLLVCVGKAAGTPEDLLIEQLATAKERALNVLGGFCGWYGNCGAAVGFGIFMSVYTDASPHSEKNWADCNRATGKALLKIAEIDGPRCCKRNSYLTLLVAVDMIEEILGINLEKPEKLSCIFYEKNAECKKEQCPFYPQASTQAKEKAGFPISRKNVVKADLDVFVPERMKPDHSLTGKDCECLKRDHLLKYKTGYLHWLKEEGSYVQAETPIAELEIEKKAFIILAPETGVLKTWYIEDDSEFSCRDAICCMEIIKEV